MTTPLTLRSVKGSALTHNEVDGNFTALRTTADGALPNSGTVTNPALTVDSNLSGAFQILDAQGTRLMFDFDSIQGNKSGDTIFPALDDVWNLGKATNNRWQNAYISRTIELGDTPFIFTESSPGVLQLGQPAITVDAVGALSIFGDFSSSTFGYGLVVQSTTGTATGGLLSQSALGASASIQTLTTDGSNAFPTLQVVGNTAQTANLTEWVGNDLSTIVASMSPSGVLSGTSVVIPPVNVVNLPAAPIAGEKAMVNNALAPAFGVAVAGSGGVTVPVFYDGAQWVVG